MFVTSAWLCMQKFWVHRERNASLIVDGSQMCNNGDSDVCGCGDLSHILASTNIQTAKPQSVTDCDKRMTAECRLLHFSAQFVSSLWGLQYED